MRGATPRPIHAYAWLLIRKRLETAWHIARRGSPFALLRTIVNRFLLPQISQLIKPFWLSKLRTVAAGGTADHPTVLILATCDYRFPYRQRCQHLAKAIAELGHTVFYGSPLTGYDRVLGYSTVADRLYVADYQMPWRDILPAGAVVLAMSTDNRVDMQFVAETRALRWRLIYDYIDAMDERISLAPIPESHLKAHANMLRDESVRVVCVAPKLLEEAASHRSRNLYLVPNGVDRAHYRVARQRETLSADMRAIVDRAKPIVGYFGALACWVDYDLVLAVALARPDLSFVLIGPDFDGSLSLWRRANRGLPGNLFFLSPVTYELLPNLAVWFDVGMIPFVVNQITAATSPLKLYEFFALEIPVVSSPLPDCETYGDVVAIAEGAERFAYAVDLAIARRADGDCRRHLGEYAAQSDWQSRARDILSSSPQLVFAE
jgi:hypothetical protein